MCPSPTSRQEITQPALQTTASPSGCHREINYSSPNLKATFGGKMFSCSPPYLLTRPSHYPWEQEGIKTPQEGKWNIPWWVMTRAGGLESSGSPPSQCPVLCPGPPSSPGERGVPVREGAYSLEMLPLVKLKEKNKTGFLMPNERDLFQC